MSASTERTALSRSREWSDVDYTNDEPGFFQGREPSAVATKDAKEVVGRYAQAIREALDVD